MTYWCIVTYVEGNPTPYYYCGYYKKIKPVISINFNEALKLDDPQEAKKIKRKLGKRWVIEEHMYLDNKTQ